MRHTTGRAHRHGCRGFRDPRYIRVEARPLFLVYRASDLPDVAGTRRPGGRRPSGTASATCSCAANSQNVLTPQALAGLGFDAVVEIEPNLRDLPLSRTMPEAPGLHLYDYRTLAERAMARSAGPVTVFPGCSPRGQHGPARLARDDRPERRCDAVSPLARSRLHEGDGEPESERLVFINAWNEWAEGCHLEPDSRHGRIFFEATAAALGIEGERRADDGPAAGSTAAQRAPAPRRSMSVWTFGDPSTSGAAARPDGRSRRICWRRRRVSGFSRQ